MSHKNISGHPVYVISALLGETGNTEQFLLWQYYCKCVNITTLNEGLLFI